MLRTRRLTLPALYTVARFYAMLYNGAVICKRLLCLPAAEALVHSSENIWDRDVPQTSLTTKLWGGRGYKDTVTSIDGSLKALDMDYIDLLLTICAILIVHQSFLNVNLQIQNCYRNE